MEKMRIFTGSLNPEVMEGLVNDWLAEKKDRIEVISRQSHVGYLRNVVHITIIIFYFVKE